MRRMMLSLLLFTACCVRQTGPTTPGTGTGAGTGTGTGTGGDPNAQCAKDRPCESLALDWCPDDTSRPMSLEDLLASGQQHDGHRIAVTGPLRQGPTRCTRMACSPENPCCNRCSASLLLSATAEQTSPLGADDGVTLLGDNLGCGGDDSAVCCTYQPTGRDVTAIGELHVTADAQGGFRYELHQTDVCAYRVMR